MTKNFHTLGVEKTQLMIPMYVVRKARFVQEGADVALREFTGLES
jgi:hypothetical protein